MELKRTYAENNLDFQTLKELNSQLQAELRTKDEKISELESVVDKLRSVLDQSVPASQLSTTKSPTLSSSASIKDKFFKRSKKQGVSAEAWTTNKLLEPVHYVKTPEVHKLIKSALLKNHLLRHLESKQIEEIVECMCERSIEANCNVIDEGQEATHLYVVQSGKLEVYKEKTKISEIGKETAFGELALLYKCRRTATVKACTDCVVWVIDRASFQTVMRRTCGQRHEELLHFLRSVAILKPLSDSKLTKLADLLEVQVYNKKECILREGEGANCFFIIQSGSTKVTQKLPNSDSEKEIRVLVVGEYFGEKALLSGGVRTASIYAAENNTEILCLYRKGFLSLIGDLTDLKTKEYGDEERYKDSRKPLSTISSPTVQSTFEPIQFSDIQKLKTLGLGGFGRVYLVKVKGNETESFALKCMKKVHIVKMKQQTHVMSEKSILLELQCNFICRLYQTFKDAKYVYLLMEVCLGGEVWSVLRDKVFFDDTITRFCLSCVVEAFEYLHKRCFIYRDLKPENLLISGSDGYIKLCDFGFAKKLVGGKKTWTFCGTPEYVAPEIILNKSHDASADLWSLGILTYELLNGMPPFNATDPMKIYSMTLKGIESIDLNHNKRVSAKAASLISHLCRKNAHERLGYGKNGFSDIRTHKFFQGFDWEMMEKQKLQSPFAPKVKDPFDSSNFDNYPDELEEAPEESSGWDANF